MSSVQYFWFHSLFQFQELRCSNKPVHRIQDLRLSSGSVPQGNYIRKLPKGKATVSKGGEVSAFFRGTAKGYVIRMKQAELPLPEGKTDADLSRNCI